MATRSSSKRKAEWIAPAFGDFTDTVPQKTKSRKPNFGSAKNAKSDDILSWVEKYKPTSEEDLAVHKKKIQEVKVWIETSFNNNKKVKNRCSNIMLLTGPTGSAKTATVHALRDSLQYKIKEWINPLMQEFDRENLRDYTARQDSQSQLFHDFLLRANRYEQLKLFHSKDNTSEDTKRNTVILVEDLPNFLYFDPKKMHNILRQYANNGRCPLVFVMSDSNSDNFINSLFPKNLQGELNIINISFNAVAFTSLVKTMNKIVSLESKEDADINTPSKDVLELLATSCNGDIRSCINALQFYCTDRDPRKQRAATKTKQESKRKTVKSGHSTKNTSAAVGAGFVGEKDTALFLFRALGKILYSKRDKDEEPEEERSQISSRLKQYRRKKTLINPEDVFERTQTTSENFLMYLHHNYPEFFGDIDDVSMAGDYCCEADVMNGVWSTRSTMANYAASLSIRGIMFSNSQLSSNSGASAGSGGWHPMHKPQWFESNKTVLSRERFIRDIFKVTRYSRETLFTEVLPHVGQYTSSHPLLQEVAHFPVARQQLNRSWKTSYIDLSDPLDFPGKRSDVTNETFYGGDNGDQEEEDVIEDFEDD